MESINNELKTKALELLRQSDVRVRFAPSPTGSLHIGSARTALFNYLFAKNKNGTFVLRVEDTDKERSRPEFEKEIIEGLKWLGIDWNEGPDNGEYKGLFGPYRQSERSKIYSIHIQRLIDEDKAYYCFCTPEELEAQRQYEMSRGEAPKYNKKCSTLSSQEVSENIGQGKKSIIRLRSQSSKIKFNDLIRGDIEFDSNEIGDIVVARDLNNPLYNLAVVIDDFEMKITHVIRGEDHISNTPKQIMIAQVLNIPLPIYAHFPLILATDKSKLSKRHGAVAVNDYKKEGYLAEAMVNFIAFLGWNPGTEKEIYSIESLIKDFSIDKVQKSGAVFNIKKLEFLNGYYIRQKNIDELTDLCIPYLIESKLIEEEEGITKRDFIKNAISIHQERLKKLSEISEFADFLFVKDIQYDKELLNWKQMNNEEIISSLDKSEKILSEIQNWNKENIQEELIKETDRIGDRGSILWPLRVSLTGKSASAGPFEVAEILGKEKSLERIRKAKTLLL
ncbi:MAG: glutamate--tRNA ligase [Candidatus Nealsonbacteria bacterium]|nr:glutamate--tRNA ligase [Candidatus Nealsonbacteria bacterium]